VSVPCTYPLEGDKGDTLFVQKTTKNEPFGFPGVLVEPFGLVGHLNRSGSQVSWWKRRRSVETGRTQKRRDWKEVLDTRVKWRTWSGEDPPPPFL